MSRMVTAPGRAREYETIYILRPDVDAESADKIGARVNEIVARENGKLTRVELWGRRRLAYDIAKHKRGVYFYLQYLGDGKLVAELERNLRLSDSVIKFQTVLTGNDVELGEVAVEDEAVKFERLELPPLEEERDESRERQLGLVEPERHVHRVEAEAPELEGDAEIEGAGEAAQEEEG